jgi:hypothetical protein
MAGQKERLTRAEMVRRRRAGAAGQSAAASGKSAAADTKSQPAQSAAVMQSPSIFVRQGSMGTAVVERTRTRVKRKVTLPLRKGAEMVFPGLPIIKFSWRAFSGLLALVLAGFLGYFAYGSEFLVSTLSINGLRRVSATDIATVLNLGGMHAFLLDPQDILLDIETSFPEFFDVDVSVDFPAAINIGLTERDPVLAWEYESLTLWVDSDGNVFTPRGEAEGLITVQSTEAPPRIKVQMTDREIEIARELGILETEDEVMMKDGPVDPQLVQQILHLNDRKPEITKLTYSDKAGYGWHDEKRDMNVFFGPTLDDLDQKLLLFDAIKDYVSERNINVSAISVAFTQAPYYRVGK